LLRRAPAIEAALGDHPRRVDIRAEEPAHSAQNAHTVKNHGADIPLRRADNPGGKTIEGRIYGDSPWLGAENASYRWVSDEVMNSVVDSYLRANWADIVADLALNGRHVNAFDAGQLVGEGFYNTGMHGVGPRVGKYARTGLVRLVVLLDPGPPVDFFVMTSFPNALGTPAH